MSPLHAVALHLHLHLPQEVVSSNFIDFENLSHSSIGGQIRVTGASPISWCEDNEHFNVLGCLEIHDLCLQIEVLRALVREDHYEGALRSVLERKKEPLGHLLSGVSAATKGEPGSLLSEGLNVSGVNLSCSTMAGQ